MIAVAITRWSAPAESEAAALAPLMNEGIYELRLRLVRPLPVVLARVNDPERARELLAALRARGHGAVACDLDFVPSSERMLCPKSYRFDDDAFVVDDRGHRMPYADMLALIRARAAIVSDVQATMETKRLSLGRAVMSGGLVLSKTTTRHTHETHEDSEQVLYLIRRDGRDPMLLREQRLQHHGVEIRPTSTENFVLLVASLRERAPHAFYDERMMTRRRPAQFVRTTGSTKERTTTHSNSEDTDLAAHLLAIAHRSGQL